MFEQERRKADRLHLTPSIPGRMQEHEVRLVNIGVLGTTVEHDKPLIVGGPHKLRFKWDGEEIEVDCTVVHSEQKANIFKTGLSFVARPTALRRVLDTLNDRDEMDRLKTLVEASKLINSSIEPDALFGSILTVARNELHVDRGTLWFVDDEKKEIWTKVAGEFRATRPIGTGIAGTVVATGEPIILHDAYADSRFDRTADEKSGYRTRSMLCVPIRNRDRKIVGALQLLNKNDGAFGQGDLDFLSSISEHMAIAMENATLHIELLEKQRMEEELKLGREIQSRLLPQPPIDVLDTDLAALSVPCYEVGGDYYDFLELPDGDLGLAIGDVSGKGVSAALIMSSVQAALRVAAPIEDDLARLVQRLNALIYRSARGRKYATFFFGRYTPSTGLLRYVNAGHNPPFIGIDGKLEELMSTGKPIGILPDSTYHERDVEIPPGATLFLYTDGLNEAADPDDNEFGYERLRELFMKTHDPAAIVDAVTQFERGVRATDDKTIVVLRRM